MTERKDIVRGTVIFSAMTAVSRVTGYGRELVRAVYLGTSDASDAFGVAITIPNMFRSLVAEGAMNAAFVPVLSDLKNKDKKAWADFIGGSFTLLSAVLTFLAVAGAIASPFLASEIFARGFKSEPAKLELTIKLTQIAFVYLLFVGLSAFVQGILNSFKIFGPSAFTPALLNLAVIAFAALLSPLMEQPAYAFVLGFAAGGLLQLLFQLPYLYRVGAKIKPNWKWRDPNVIRALKLLAPVAFGFGVYEINVALSQLIASYLGEGAYSSLQYSNRILELPLGLFVTALATVILPTLAENAHTGDMESYKQNLAFALKLTLFLTLPAAAFLVALRGEIFSALLGYGRFDETSIRMCAYVFAFHVVGMPFIGLSRVLVRAFNATEETKLPVVAAFYSMIINVILSWFFAFYTPLGNGGIAFASSIAAAAQTGVLIYYLSARKKLRLNWGSIAVSALKVAAAAAAVFAIAFAARESVEWGGKGRTLAFLCLCAAVCASFYFGALLLLKEKEAVFLKNFIARKFLRRGNK